MTAYRKDNDETKFTSFLVKDDELFEKYNQIWEKVKDNLKSEFETQPVHNKKYLKDKIKPYNGKIHTNLHNNNVFFCIHI